MQRQTIGHWRLWLLVAGVLAAVALWWGWPRSERTTPATAPAPSASGAASSPRRASRGVLPGDHHIALSEARRTVAEGIGAIEGRVLVDGSDRGVHNAELVFDDGSLHAVRTDDAGRFVFTAPKEGVYELALVQARGFVPFAPEHGHSPMVFTARRGSGLTGARIYLRPVVDYTVTVVTPGADPQPVAGAAIVALGGRAEGATLAATRQTWVTNAEGQATVHGTEDTIFEASHADYAPGRARLDFSAQVSHRMTIALRHADAPERRKHAMTGRVAFDEQPVAGALVVAIYEADNPARSRAANIPVLRTTTDDEGGFVFTDLAEGRYRITASAPGFSPTGATHAFVPGESVELTLSRGRSLFGKVTDAAGAPIPSFVVVVRERLGPLRQEVVIAEPTFDPDGEYAIVALRRGVFLVTVSAFGFAPSETREIRIDDRDVEESFTLETGAMIEGQIVDAHTRAPIEGARISLEGSFGGRRAVQLSAGSRSDEKGRFTLRGVGAGPQSILAAAADHHGTLMSLDIDAGERHEVTIALTPTEAGEEPRIELAGIGAVLSAKDDALLIGRVIDGGGAAEAGLAPDDAILAIDGIPVVELGFAGGVRKIRGPVGSVVRLVVRKAGTDGVVTIEVVRRKIRG